MYVLSCVKFLLDEYQSVGNVDAGVYLYAILICHHVHRFYNVIPINAFRYLHTHDPCLDFDLREAFSNMLHPHLIYYNSLAQFLVSPKINFHKLPHKLNSKLCIDYSLFLSVNTNCC